MLGDYLQVRVRFDRHADQGCPFRLLRKREENGKTVFWVENCLQFAHADRRQTPPALEPGVLRLGINRLGLAPVHAGRVEYQLLSQTSSDPSKPVFAEMALHLVAKDPTPPSQAPIARPLPNCSDAQLQVRALPVENYGKWKALRAYEGTNTSGTACSVAGVPDLSQIDEHGMRLPFYAVHPCPNCPNEIFGSRPNGRIDLLPGASAHFLVGATAINTEDDPWMHCSKTPGVVLTISPASKPIDLPFDIAPCAAIDISAWRSGPFDHDPLNLAWSQRSQKALLHAQDLPLACRKPNLNILGEPSFLSGRSEVALGLSLPRHQFVFGADVLLHVWVFNRSNLPQAVATCQSLDYFKARAFDVYDAYGHRVLSHNEMRVREHCKTNPSAADVEWTMWACMRNFTIPIAANACVTGDDYDFTMNLKERFDLPQGEYTVHLRPEEERIKDICKTGDEPVFSPGPADLTFAVVQP